MKINYIKTIILFLLLSILLGIPLSNFTEKTSLAYAVRLMQLLRFGSPIPHKRDMNGVPLIRYPNLGNKYYYNPVYVGIYGLYYYDKWQKNGENNYFLDLYLIYNLYPPKYSNNIKWQKDFISCANWFVENIQIKIWNNVKYGVYYYNFSWPKYELNSPWISGMAQALAMQVLVRAWMATGNDVYRNTADLARNAFYVPVDYGGVTYMLSDDEWWFAEYAAPKAKRPYVLNGMEHALIALFEYASYTNDNNSKILFLKGLNVLEKKIKNYTAPNMLWTLYDLDGTVANLKYHEINVNLTRRLYALTSNEKLSIYEKWQNFNTPFFIREFIYQIPNEIDMIALLLNIFAIYSLFIIYIIYIILVNRSKNDN